MFTDAKSKLTTAEFRMVELLLAESQSRTVAANFLRKRFTMPARVATMMVQTWHDPVEGELSGLSRSRKSQFEVKTLLFAGIAVFMAVTVLVAVSATLLFAA